ncbi:hypothetical protein KPH14_009785 [Odynerus spinipes]|uniref:Uncharacterized protein n=1 Tax=Odynerus spinipes TaxID=1348599 RepID=A0AAD9VUQ9_9HYME|nr:hypothetical protein KPH14_009785 [Odynerus spinipes]
MDWRCERRPLANAIKPYYTRSEFQWVKRKREERWCKVDGPGSSRGANEVIDEDIRQRSRTDRTSTLSGKPPCTRDEMRRTSTSEGKAAAGSMG